MTEIALEDRPSTPRAEYSEVRPDITLIRNLLAGTRRMHDQYKAYIPKYKAEKPESYKRRATIAKVYGGLNRTLSAAVGMLFAKPPELAESFSPQMLQHWENLDGKGTHGKVLAKRRAEDAIADGFTVILVDFPKVPPGVVVTAANEEALNLRPLWASYARADVLSWRTAVIDNVERLVQVVLREGATVPAGRFGAKQQVRYRVASLALAPDPAAVDPTPVMMAVWQLLEEVEQQGQVTVVERERGIFRGADGAPFRQIPLAVCYAGRTDATLCAHPPLLDVAWANLEHWRVATNLRYYEDLCCFPQPTVVGELAQDENGVTPPFQLGPGVLVKLTAGSEFKWTEVAGGSIDKLRASLQEKKDEIAELGMSFLAKRSRAVETAEAKRLDAAAENSTLATSAQGIEDGINEALRFHALYLGIEAAKAPTVTINRDFENGAMDAATMGVYVQAVADAGLPPRMLLEAWQHAGRIAPDADLDAIELEMLASKAAEADRKEQEAKDRAKAQPPAAA